MKGYTKGSMPKEKGVSLLANPLISLERETGFGPATSTLARLHSTTELFPRVSFVKYQKLVSMSMLFCMIFAMAG